MSEKDTVIEAIRELPDSATVQEISEEVALLAALQRAKEASAAGRVVSHDEVRKRVATWTSK